MKPKESVVIIVFSLTQVFSTTNPKRPVTVVFLNSSSAAWTELICFQKEPPFSNCSGVVLILTHGMPYDHASPIEKPYWVSPHNNIICCLTKGQTYRQLNTLPLSFITGFLNFREVKNDCRSHSTSCPVEYCKARSH